MEHGAILVKKLSLLCTREAKDRPILSFAKDHPEMHLWDLDIWI